jgi:peptidoglycan/xylan/chitin deacetylase (PgdA/CDA1 family)
VYLKQKAGIRQNGFILLLSVLFIFFGLSACDLDFDADSKKQESNLLLTMQALHTQEFERLASLSPTLSVDATETPISSHGLIDSQEIDLSSDLSITPSPTPPPVISSADLEGYAWCFFEEHDESFSVIEGPDFVENTRLLSLREMPLVLIPLHDDLFLDTNQVLKIIPVPANSVFQVAFTKTLENQYGLRMDVAVLANTFSYGQKWLAAVITELSYAQDISLRFAELYEDPESLVSFISTADHFSADKIENVLIALREISLSQNSSNEYYNLGYYSFMQLIGLDYGQLAFLYKEVENDSYSLVRADGIDSVANAISNLLYLRQNTNWIKRSPGDNAYQQGPFSPLGKNVVTQAFYSPNHEELVDLSWKQDGRGYLGVQAFLYDDGLAYIDPSNPNPIPSSGLVYSLYYLDEVPEQSEMIQSLIDSFQTNGAERKSNLESDANPKTARSYDLSDVQIGTIAKQFFDIQDLAFISDDLKENALLNNLIDLIQILNQNRLSNSENRLNELENTDWFAEYQVLIEHPSANITPSLASFSNLSPQDNVSQAINDAVGLSTLYASMDFEAVDHHQLQRVCEIIFNPMPENKADRLHENKVQLSWFFQSGDYQVGDLFVAQGESCEIGLVVGKSGSKLLVAVPNYFGDGQIQTFFVDERNMDVVFGEMKYVLPGKKEHSFGTLKATLMDWFKPGVVTTVDARSYEGIQLPYDSAKEPALFDNNIVITVDDCYHNHHVRAIFELLKDNGLTATFFPNTNYLKFDDETISLWREIYQAGFEIGYHTTHHGKDLSYEALDQDFLIFTEHMREMLGDDNFSINLVRAPYGEWYENWHRWAMDNGFMSMRWNVLTEHSPKRANDKLEEGVSPVVLLHSTALDVDWLNKNLIKLIKIARRYDGIVGSVHDCIHRE